MADVSHAATESPLAPISAADWDGKCAGHLLRRAGFGAPHGRVAELEALGPEGAVDAFLDFETDPKPGPLPSFLVSNAEVRRAREAVAGEGEEARRRAQQELNRAQRQAVQHLGAWWLERMAQAEHPLEEKLRLFWHGHFAVSAQKVRPSEWVWEYFETLRIHGAGNAKRLAIAVGQSPAMLRYLDNARSTARQPNENWARELLELFTMGQGHYTERDIKEAARAFTGWGLRGNAFAVQEEHHDGGVKTFLGRRGHFDGWDIVDIIFEQPQTARHLARKLWAYFAEPDPAPESVDALAAVLRGHDYALRPALRAMFLSRAFYGPGCMAAQIKSPAQFMVQLAADMALPQPPYDAMNRACRGLGQWLFHPPNVKGWDGGRAWINANTLLTRYNLPLTLAAAPPEPEPATMESPMMEAMASGPAMAESRQERARDLLRALPKDERRAAMRRLRDAENPRARARIVGEVRRRAHPESTFQVRRMAEGLEYATAGEAADALAARYLAVPLQSDQRAEIIEALGADDAAAPLTPDALDQSHLEAALRLLFSSAEYQLC